MKRWLFGLLLVGVGLLFLAVMANLWQVGPDYFVYRTTAEKWLQGTTRLYDENGRNFFNMPWTLLLIIPLTFFPLKMGMAVLNLASLVALVGAARLFQKTKHLAPVYIVPAIVTLYTILLLLNGQLDAFVLLGLAISWWAIGRHRPEWLSLGLTLLLIKPLNVALVILILVIAVRHWSVRDWLKAIALPVVLSLVAGFVIGFDWPLRYIENYFAFPPITEDKIVTLWRVAALFNLSTILVAVSGIIAAAALIVVAWRRGVDEWTLNAALAVTFIWTPYAWNYHYIMLIPAFLFVARVNRRVAWAIFSVSWLLTVRLAFGGGVYSLVDIVYPILLGVFIWMARPKLAVQSAPRTATIQSIQPEIADI